MLRTIKFRGKRIDTGEWVFGDLVSCSKKHAYIVTYFEKGEIIPEEALTACKCVIYKVKVETVGQFTDRCDKNGKEIYEGDIYKKHNNTYLVIWASHGFMWQTIYDNWLNKNIFSRAEKSWLSEIDCKNFIEVIGNIHDNPELIHDQKAEVEG